MGSLRNQDSHLDEALRLRYIDGELPAWKARQVARHLEACWQCRTEIEELQRTVGDCVRYRKTLGAHLPPPPAPWRELDFDKIDAELNTEPWTARLARALGFFARPRVAVPAVAVVLALVFVQLRQTPSVQAAALLKQAVAAGARTQSRREVRVRTASAQWTRVVGAHPPAGDSSARHVETLLAAAHYDTEDPLSARAHQSWREQLAEKQDEVVSSPGTYRIRTSTPEGELRAATLTLRAHDLYPLEERLEFENQEWVEFTDITDATTRNGELPTEAKIGLPARRAEPSRPTVASSGSAPSISEELQVVAALHEIGADLGEPLEISRTGESVVVRGMGIPSRRQDTIRNKLEGIPKVTLEFSDPVRTVPDTGTAAVAEPAAGGVVPSALQASVEQKLGGHAEFERFSTQMLDRNEALMSRAYALRGLAQRFPAQAEAQMSAADRQKLRQMAREHLAALVRNAAANERALQSVVAVPATAPPAPARPESITWQAAAEDLFHSAQRSEELLSAILGTTPPDTPLDRLPNDLLAFMAGVRANADRCRTSLSRE